MIKAIDYHEQVARSEGADAHGMALGSTAQCDVASEGKALGEREDTQRRDDPFVKRADELTIEKSFFAIDKIRADELIANHLAKNMIFPGGKIESSGRECVNVSLGDIDNAFSDGEKIDINDLKDKKICPEDAFKIRIIADGTLSKSFTVFANEFDTSAVKMIALSGGRAVRVKSKKKRH